MGIHSWECTFFVVVEFCGSANYYLGINTILSMDHLGLFLIGAYCCTMDGSVCHHDGHSITRMAFYCRHVVRLEYASLTRWFQFLTTLVLLDRMVFYTHANSGNYILVSDTYHRILIAMIVASVVTTAKRMFLTVRFGRRMYGKWTLHCVLCSAVQYKQ